MGKVVMSADPSARDKEWNSAQIGFLKPIRYTDHLLVKSTYGQLGRLIVRFPQAKIVRAKAAAHGGLQAVYAKVPTRFHDILYDIDECMIESCKQHRESWFGDRSKMLDDFITEFYVPCFVMDRTYGNLIKLHVMPDEDSDESLTVDKERIRDISMVLVGLRFNKRTYCTVWKKLEDKDAQPETLPWRDEDEQEDFQDKTDEDIDSVVPDLEAITEGLLNRSQLVEKEIRDRGAKLAEMLERTLAARKSIKTGNTLEELVKIDNEMIDVAAQLQLE
jgi:hypothetical protein